jgi:hypothetical protein
MGIVVCLTCIILTAAATNYTATNVNIVIGNIVLTSNTTVILNAPPATPYQIIEVIN